MLRFKICEANHYKVYGSGGKYEIYPLLIFKFSDGVIRTLQY